MQHYKWIKSANRSSKMQSKVGPVPGQMTWQHKGTAAYLNEFNPAEQLTYEYHNKAQLTTNGCKSQWAPVKQPHLRKPLQQPMKNQWQHYEEQSMRTPSHRGSPWPAYTPASILLWSQRSRGVDILYRHPLHWLNSKTLKMYFKGHLLKGTSLILLPVSEF